MLLGVVGIGNALIDVGGFTLLARLTDETVLARMFAGFEAILTLGVAAGGLLAPLIIELLGVRPALVAIGLLAPLAVAASWPALRRLDCAMRVRDADIEILRGVGMLGALPAATIEQLAARLEHAELRARADRVRAGRARRALLRRRGRPGRGRPSTVTSSRRSAPATCFGEIALLRTGCGRPPCAPSTRGALRVSRAPAQRLPDRRDRLPGERGRGRGGRDDPARGPGRRDRLARTRRGLTLPSVRSVAAAAGR